MSAVTAGPQVASALSMGVDGLGGILIVGRGATQLALQPLCDDNTSSECDPHITLPATGNDVLAAVAGRLPCSRFDAKR
jgi:hypothetical protein